MSTPRTRPDHVLRGGPWGIYAMDCRSARRRAGRPGFRDRYVYVGFRIVIRRKP